MASRTRIIGAVIIGLTTVMLATACASTDSTSSDAWLDAYSLDDLGTREVIERLEAMPVDDRPADLMASLEPDALLLSDDAGNQASLDMPKDKFYVSIAPYADQTHDCYFHSLTTCLGELDNEDIQVTITDTADDTVLVDESVRTQDNGFAGVWLPRGIDATVTIERAGESARMPISTKDDDPTCLTTLQLA